MRLEQLYSSYFDANSLLFRKGIPIFNLDRKMISFPNAPFLLFDRNHVAQIELFLLSLCKGLKVVSALGTC